MGAARTRGRQGGAAVITALLVVALATLAVTGVLWRQQVQARAVENQILLAESRWLARGAIDWARVMLRYDRSQGVVDHAGEFWATPLAEVKISDIEPGGLREGYLSGQISDEQSRFNLLNLAAKGEVDEAQAERFAILLDTVGLDPQLALVIARAIARTEPRSLGGRDQTERATALPMLVVEDLLRIGGLDAAALDRLRPFVVLLPRTGGEPVKVNINTASAEVLRAAVPRLTLAQARALVEQRGHQFQFFRDATGDLPNKALGVGAALGPEDVAGVDVQSSFFRIRGRIRYDRALVGVEAVIYRSPAAPYSTRVLWQQEN